MPAIGDVDAQLTTALTFVNGQQIYALSSAERQAIHAVYQLYDSVCGQPVLALRPPMLDTCRHYIEMAYEEVQIRRRLASLRSLLLANSDTCPYCGYGDPVQLDHYLPKSVYGELAIYPRNLIPCCGPCNNAKRAVIQEAHVAGFPHPYLEPIPDVVFLDADVTYNNGALSVVYKIRREDIDPLLHAKLEYQLTRLTLNERYTRQINKFLSEQRTGVLVAHSGAMPALTLSAYLSLSADNLAADFGRNDWRVALMRALAVNEAFCTYPQPYFGERRILEED